MFYFSQILLTELKVVALVRSTLQRLEHLLHAIHSVKVFNTLSQKNWAPFIENFANESYNIEHECESAQYHVIYWIDNNQTKK